MVHKRRGSGLGWNYAALAIPLLLLAYVLALGGVEFVVVPWALARLALGAVVFVIVLRAVTRRAS